jgi:hypothetical protein|nr:MAG TPA: hypothetical protein [Caudoviricetes sp.]
MGTPRAYAIVVKQFKGEWHRKVRVINIDIFIYLDPTAVGYSHYKDNLYVVWEISKLYAETNSLQ